MSLQREVFVSKAESFVLALESLEVYEVRNLRRIYSSNYRLVTYVSKTTSFELDWVVAKICCKICKNIIPTIDLSQTSFLIYLLSFSLLNSPSLSL